jgi:hypothetical protein
MEIHKEKSNKIQQCIKIFIIPYLYEAQHVSGDTRLIIRSLKLHWTLSGTVFSTLPDNFHQLQIQQPSTYEKPEAASAVLGS